ncbi:uncharacterized protein KGF55_004134 [Candida pseudojiufengensis]|uniref:uncharacterized protein n=1 Tax=Candida pseudojiufengensis TaxID=497109 RepID=UPI0022258F89|nr:uncharacterized protein KGF55_004134 [Candida pseudojiufengensis]KAI5961209.1 hypothetical protein KGF55_004134 [Candida pseudojiufengensis]
MSKKLKLDNMVKICTHSGSFHADESLAVYLLKLLPKFSNAEVIRSRNPEDWERSDIVVDVSGKYDQVKYFDHHQREFDTTFNNNYKTKLSSAGLIYKHFGKDIIQEVLNLQSNDSNVELLYDKVYKEFIESLDANDNGISNYPKDIESKFNEKNITLPAMVAKFNPRWNESCKDEDFDRQFLIASELMGKTFVNLLEGYGKGWLPAKSIVEKAFENRFNVDKSGEIIILSQFCPWKEHLYAIEKKNNAEGSIKFVLFQDASGNWRISTVSITSSSFEFRKGIPEELRGLRDEELSNKSGIEGCIFVHAAGFIGGAKTEEGVLKLAKLSLQKD